MSKAEREQGLTRLFSVRHEFSSEWHRFLHPAGATAIQTLTLPLKKKRFPFLFQGKTITINKIELYIKVAPEPDFMAKYTTSKLKFTLAAGDTAPNVNNADPNNDILPLASWNGMLHAEKPFTNLPGSWTMNAWLNAGDRLDAEALEDILMVCHYTITE